MPATYTFDVFCTLDGFASYGPDGDWGAYWGKQGPELIEHREAQHREPQRLVLGAATFRELVAFLGTEEARARFGDQVNLAMRQLPTTVVSRTLRDTEGWPDATIEAGDAVDVVARMQRDSDVPLRSHGSLSMNRALLAAGLVDLVQVTIFPVLSGRTGTEPVFAGVGDHDLELVGQRTFDGRTVELTYRPRPHAAGVTGE